MAFSFLNSFKKRISFSYYHEFIRKVRNLVSKFQSLKKNRDFRRVYRMGKSKANHNFVMIVLKNDLPYNRIGISVSKKVGNSVVRHRVTRVIREIIRLQWEEIKQGYDIVIVARSSAANSDYKIFESAINHLLKIHHLPVLREE